MDTKNNSPNETDAVKLLGIVGKLASELQRNSIQHITPTLDSSLDRDLGFDSLTRVELMARIEKAYDLVISDQTLAIAETPRDFLRAIQQRSKKDFTHTAQKVEIRTQAGDETVPEQAETLIQVLQHQAVYNPEHPHIRLYSEESEGEIITYSELWQAAQKTAANLQKQGLDIGETVLIMLPTGRDYFISFFGILLAGGVPVPMYPPGRMKQLEEHLRRHTAIANNCLARFMITMPEAKRFAQLMHQQVPNLFKIYTPVELASDSGLNTEYRIPIRDSSATAFLQYTSGSTGMPKGVVLSHANLLANIRSMGNVLRVTGKDIFVSWLPLYHDMGLIGAWLGSLYYGCPFIVMPPLSFIAKPIRWLQAIHRFGGTLSAAPNFAFELCLRRIDDKELEGLDLHSWRCAFNGAEAVSPVTLRRFIERFSRAGFHAETMMPVYGLAESSVGLAFPLKRRKPVIDRVWRQALMDTGKAEPAAGSAEGVLEFVSCGQPLPGHQVRIVDDANRELPDRHQGKLQFLGPSATSGYFRNPEATGDLFQGKWLNSGDLGYIADGDIYITGRSKDIVIRAGRNIYPTELEEAISAVEGVISGNVAVFGSLDPESGTERLLVLAETRKRKPDAQRALIIAINTIVNDICGTPPDEVVLAPPNTVLKTSSGKIRRNASRQLYENGDVGKAQPAVWIQVIRFILSGMVPQIKRFGSRLATWLYAAYAWLLFGLAAPFVWVATAILPIELWRWVVIRIAVRALARLTNIPIAFEGKENMPQAGTPCIFVCNHASYLDSIVLAGILPPCVSFIAKADFKNKFLVRFPLQRLGAIFVERFTRNGQEMDDLRKLLPKKEKNRSIMFFAEGTLMRMPGLLPFRLGAFEAAVDHRLPIIPIALRGTRFILRGDSWFPRHGRIRIETGSPVSPEKILARVDGDRWQAILQLRDQVRYWILKHSGEPDLQHERPPVFTSAQSQQKAGDNMPI
jgi:1-acyl-sn-glycerol-3-phosphate acyltransferase